MLLRELNNSVNVAVIFHKELNPKLWNHNKQMKPMVRYKLLSIAENFIKFIDIPELGLQDITISGSNAAYTYTPNSDIDLHLVVNIPDDNHDELVQLFNAKKNQYNFNHHIKIKNIDIEVYVQDNNEKHISAGIYSILDDRWLSQPHPVKVQVNEPDVKQKVDNYYNIIMLALQSKDLEIVTAIMKRLRSLRNAGLQKEGEFSIENLAFKVLRAQGYFDKLQDHLYNLQDDELSMENITNASR